MEVLEMREFGQLLVTCALGIALPCDTFGDPPESEYCYTTGDHGDKPGGGVRVVTLNGVLSRGTVFVVAPGHKPGDSLEYPFLRIRNDGASATFVVKVLEGNKVNQVHYRSKVIRQTDEWLKLEFEEVDENFKSLVAPRTRVIKMLRQRGDDAFLIPRQGEGGK
jgi:hypothetical protein